MARRILFFVLMSMAIAAAGGELVAGVISAKRGVVEKISPDGKTLTIKFARAEETTDLSVAGEIDVLLDGKHVPLTAIKPGMSVTVQVDGAVAQRIIARAASDGEPKTTKSPKPKATISKAAAKTATTRKSKQLARKSSKSSGKKGGPSALDDMPVATTPLAAMQNAPGEKKNGPSPLDSLPVAVIPGAGSKSSSSGKNSGPNALDSLPVATTPLAGSKGP
jgi:hypothetical protein